MSNGGIGGTDRIFAGPEREAGLRDQDPDPLRSFQVAALFHELELLRSAEGALYERILDRVTPDHRLRLLALLKEMVDVGIDDQLEGMERQIAATIEFAIAHASDSEFSFDRDDVVVSVKSTNRTGEFLIEVKLTAEAHLRMVEGLDQTGIVQQTTNSKLYLCEVAKQALPAINLYGFGVTDFHGNRNPRVSFSARIKPEPKSENRIRAELHDADETFLAFLVANSLAAPEYRGHLAQAREVASDQIDADMRNAVIREVLGDFDGAVTQRIDTIGKTKAGESRVGIGIYIELDQPIELSGEQTSQLTEALSSFYSRMLGYKVMVSRSGLVRKTENPSTIKNWFTGAKRRIVVTTISFQFTMTGRPFTETTAPDQVDS